MTFKSLLLYHFSLIFGVQQPLVTICFHWVENSSKNILLNILFCALRKKDTGLEQHKGEQMMIVFFHFSATMIKRMKAD